MSEFLAAQHRLIYTLLKPVVRAAARFDVSISNLADLLRVAYFEALLREYQLPISQIAKRFGQSERHMRSLSKRLASDFFLVEREVGLVREIEAVIASERPTRAELLRTFSTWSPQDVRAAVDKLETEARISVNSDGRLSTSEKYAVMRSDGFSHRIDALNHYLDGAYQAVLQRMVFDNSRTAMIKTMTFSAIGEELEAYLARLEGDLRRDFARLEESAQFAGKADEVYTFSLTLAPKSDEPTISEES